MTYNQFFKEPIKQVYILYGDSFLAINCIDFIKEKLNIKSEYDISIFDSENFSVDAVIESCEQVSFFAKNRLIIIKNTTKLNESEKTKFKKYLKNINPSCVIVLLDSLKSNIFDFTDVEKVNLDLTDFELENLVKQMFEKKGKSINSETISLLNEFCQKNLSKISLEVNKLVAYCDEKESVTMQDVEKVVPASEELVVFELTKALGEKNASKSLKILLKLMGNVEQNNKLFSLMSSTFQRMFFTVVSKNMSDLEIANKFLIKEYAIKKLRLQAKNFTASKLKNIVYEFCELEYMVKNGLMSLDNALVYIVEFILQ